MPPMEVALWSLWFPLKNVEINLPVSMESFLKIHFAHLLYQLEEKEEIHIVKTTDSMILYCMLSLEPWSTLDIRNLAWNGQLLNILNMYLSKKVNGHYSSDYHIFFNHPQKHLSYILLLKRDTKRETLRW